MNNEESRFHDLLNEPRFDDSYRNEHRAQLRQQILQAFDTVQADRSRQPARRAILSWKEFLSRPAPRLVALLLLAVTVCTLFAVLFRPQATIAFDRLVGPILKAKTARFNLLVELKDLPKQTIRMLVLEPNHLRQEPLHAGGPITISDANAGKVMLLTPAQKTAIVINITDMPEPQQPANYFDHLRTNLRTASDDTASKREPLGRKQIAGREAVGFRVTVPTAEMLIWGDPETGRPIVVEMKSTLSPDTKITMTDFEFDVELDESLFKIVPPEGYILQEFNMTTPTENNIVVALKLLSDDNDGRFPDTFSHTAIGTFISNWVQKNPGKPDAAWTKKMTSMTLPLSQGLVFAATLPAESNARYAGKGVKSGDAATPVFWYKPAGASNYRVIYGDFSIKEKIAAPESPNAAPVTMAMNVKDMTDAMRKNPPPALQLPELPKLSHGVDDSPDKFERKPADPAARKILDQMAKVYADCKSYRDTGVVTTTTFEDPDKNRKPGNRVTVTGTNEKPFTTAFVRPDRFRFEFNDKYSLVDGRQSRHIIWSHGKEVQTWWDHRPPGIKKPESLELAIAGATGISSLSAATIPALLLGQAWGNITHLPGAKLVEVGKLGDAECFRVEGTFGKSPRTVWIDKKSYLVRRIDTEMKFEKFRTEQTTTYEPTINEPIADKLLEFDPPITK